MRVSLLTTASLVLAALLLIDARNLVMADDADGTSDVAVTTVWQPADEYERRLRSAWRMHEADLLLQTQGRREPWATLTEAAIANYVARRYADGGAVLVRAQCGETICRISLECDDRLQRARFNSAILSSSGPPDDWQRPAFLDPGASVWNRPDGHLEMIIPASPDSMPVFPLPTSRPPDSVLELFLGPSSEDEAAPAASGE